MARKYILPGYTPRIILEDGSRKYIAGHFALLESVGTSISADSETYNPGDTATVTLSGSFTEITAVTINSVSASFDDTNFPTSVDASIPALSTFVSGGGHAATRWATTINLTLTDSVLGDVSTTIQIVSPETSGDTYWFGTADTQSEFSVFPEETVSGDDYFLEETAGEIAQVNPDGTISATMGSGNYSVQTRIFDVSAGSWSDVDTVNYVLSTVESGGITGKIIGKAIIGSIIGAIIK